MTLQETVKLKISITQKLGIEKSQNFRNNNKSKNNNL